MKVMCYAILMFTFSLIEQLWPRGGGGGRGAGEVSTANPVGAETAFPSAGSQKVPIPVLLWRENGKKTDGRKWFSNQGEAALQIPIYALFMVALIDPATNTARVVCQVPMIVVHQGGKMKKKLTEKMAEKRGSRVGFHQR